MLVKEQKGGIDVLFANAGIAEFKPLGSITESHFDKSFDINVKGLLFTVQKTLPLFQDGGSIILTASGATSKGAPALSVYSATDVAIETADVVLMTEDLTKIPYLKTSRQSLFGTLFVDGLGFILAFD